MSRHVLVSVIDIGNTDVTFHKKMAKKNIYSTLILQLLDLLDSMLHASTRLQYPKLEKEYHAKYLDFMGECSVNILTPLCKFRLEQRFQTHYYINDFYRHLLFFKGLFT